MFKVKQAANINYYEFHHFEKQSGIGIKEYLD